MRRHRIAGGRALSRADHLSVARRALGLSIAELSRRTGLTARAIAYFEARGTGLGPQARSLIARALNAPDAVLWGPSTEVLTAWLDRPDATAHGPVGPGAPPRGAALAAPDQPAPPGPDAVAHRRDVRAGAMTRGNDRCRAPPGTHAVGPKR